MAFDRIAGAVKSGQFAAGVMIHEELLYYPKLGLQRVADLGASWCAAHDLPLPVGLNVIRRDLGRPTMERICTAIRSSLLHARKYPEAAMARVSRFGRGPEGGCTEQFVSMFANEDSANMPLDVRNALPVLFRQLKTMGLAAKMPSLDIVEGTDIRVAAPAA
jgi:1,4-dihydroxy-6-naphthoate synthase